MTENETLLQRYSFEAQGKAYKVLPFPLAYVLSEDINRDINIVGGLPNNEGTARLYANHLLINTEKREVVDKWLKDYCINGKGEHMSVEKACEEGWTSDDIILFIQRVIGVSD